jgi:hypothetical protein
VSSGKMVVVRCSKINPAKEFYQGLVDALRLCQLSSRA